MKTVSVGGAIVKERPIIMSGESVREIIAGRKTQTRRVIKPQPVGKAWTMNHCGKLYVYNESEHGKPDAEGMACKHCVGDRLYGLTGDRQADYNTPHEHNTSERRGIETDTSVAQQRLHGGQRRAGVLSDAVRGIREENSGGLVSDSRMQHGQGIQDDNTLPQQQEGVQECASSDLHGIPRHSSKDNLAGSPSRRKSTEQPAKQFIVGDTRGELAGQEGTRSGGVGRKTSLSKTIGRREGTLDLGDPSRAVQPKACGQDSRDEAVVDLRDHAQGGSRLWVKEAIWVHPANPFLKYGAGRVKYDADLDDAQRKNLRAAGWRKRSPLFMPRWAARLTLEITEIRVQRVQEISEDDAKAEGADALLCPWAADVGMVHEAIPLHIWGFCERWDSLNAKRGFPWSENPWVWAITFKVVTAERTEVRP